MDYDYKMKSFTIILLNTNVYVECCVEEIKWMYFWIELISY